MLRKLVFAGLASLGLFATVPSANAMTAVLPTTAGATLPVAHARYRCGHYRYYRHVYRGCYRAPRVYYRYGCW